MNKFLLFGLVLTPVSVLAMALQGVKAVMHSKLGAGKEEYKPVIVVHDLFSARHVIFYDSGIDVHTLASMDSFGVFREPIRVIDFPDGSSIMKMLKPDSLLVKQLHQNIRIFINNQRIEKSES